MRRRIYWLLPDLASARRTMNDLLLARIEERYIHFVGPEGADMSGLHAANVLQTSDIVRAAQMGMIVGAAIGAAAGAIVAMSSVVGDTSPPAIVIALALGGSVFGAWVSSMIGASLPSRRLARFEKAIEQGSILLMVDVPRSRIDEVEGMLEAAHPEGHFEGLEPDIPAFP
jgi:hypothetical protein